MNDYISREYLLDVLLPHSWHGTNKNIVPYNDRRGYRQRDREVREVIINAPRADVRENRWIPVSERLPKAYQKILVTYEEIHWANEPTTYSVKLISFGGVVDFIAWQPLPEPYRAESEDAELCETNLQAIKNMDSKELAQFITDLTHYEDTEYEWKSNLTPLLPFEDWEDWLNRRAIYGKG